MNVDEHTALFFDASCLIAAAGSPSGGSGFLLSLCTRGLLQAVVSQPVLLEAERNIRSKLGAGALAAYRELLTATPLVVAPVPSKDRRIGSIQAVSEKDQHVAAAAVAAQVPFLLSLDQRLVAVINQNDFPFRAFLPGDFIKTILPKHTHYPSLRA